MDVPPTVNTERYWELSIAMGRLRNLLHCQLPTCIVFPNSVPDEMAVFTEPLAAALEIQDQINIKPTDRVLLVGAGRLGQLIAQTLALTGCDLRVVARHAHQQSLLKTRGIQVVSEEDVSRNPGDGMWWWRRPGHRAALLWRGKAIRPRGTLVMKSTYKGEMSVNFSSIVVDEINIVGSRCGPFEPALRLWVTAGGPNRFDRG